MHVLDTQTCMSWTHLLACLGHIYRHLGRMHVLDTHTLSHSLTHSHLPPTPAHLRIHSVRVSLRVNHVQL